MAAHFDPDRLRTTAREMAAESGVEKTPDQWDSEFRRMIRSYRRAAREAGRHDIADLPDEVIWDRIKEIAESHRE